MAGATPQNTAHAKLVEEYARSEQCDAEDFAEKRSNILLVAGEHYSKRFSQYWNRIRDSAALSQEQKLRITKNHIYKIMRLYSNAIVGYVPGVIPKPQDPKSMQDQKAAQLHLGVMNAAKQKYRFRERVRDWADDFCNIGEVGTLVYFDPSAGKPVGYEPLMDENGQPVMDEQGQPMPDESKVVRSGDFVFQNFYCFNLLRSADVKEIKDSPFLTIREMVSTKEYQERYKNDPKKSKLFIDTPDKTYIIFDGNSGEYGNAKGMTLIRRTFYRPCAEYPEGYFYYWTDEGIFEEGPIPFGVWPIAHALFDKFQNSPRGKSHIKVLRPFQVELNRSASKEAEHQITLGDDKIIMNSGTTMTQGETLPGIRGVKINGPAPTILHGRNGEQFGNYCMRQLDEMYKASLIQEENEEMPAQVDPHTLLYRSESQKKRFSLYTERFEQFLIDVWSIYLELARHYLSDDELIAAVGESEAKNLHEFRQPNQQKLGYLLELEPQTEDLGSRFGRAITFNQTLQYIGNKLEREDIGRILQNHPYLNNQEIFGDFTLDYESSQNMMLALDRGEMPEPHPSDDPDYMSKRLKNRTRKPDFVTLSTEAQANYSRLIQEYEKIKEDRVRTEIAAQNEMIPTSGALVGIDVYIPDPKNPLASSKRARVPHDALLWLVKRLEAQGSSQESLGNMHIENLRNIAGHLSQQEPGSAGPPSRNFMGLSPEQDSQGLSQKESWR